MDAIEIPLRVTGVGKANATINQVGSRLADMSRQGQITLNMRGGGGGGGAGGRGGGTPTAAFDAAQMARKQAKFGADLAIARMKGYGGDATETGVYQFQQQQRVQRATPKTIAQQIKDAFMTSRIGMGGGLMPLVNRLVPIVMALPLPLKIFAAAAYLGGRALKSLTNAAMEAAQAIREFRGAQLTSGATAAEQGQLGGVGGVAGLSGQQMADMARSFSRAISTGGVAAGYASRAGIYDPGGEIFGDVNKATNLLKWADALTKMSDAEAKRAARVTGTEPLLFWRDINGGLRETIKLETARSGLLKKQGQIPSAQLQAHAFRINNAIEDIKQSFGNVFLPIIAAGAEKIANIAQWLADAFSANWILKLLGIDPRKLENKNRSLDANTEAIKEMAQLLKNGIYGGGERARGAIPSQWLGSGPQNWARQAANLGAFTL